MKKLIKLFLMLVVACMTFSTSFADEQANVTHDDIVALYNANKLQDAYMLISQVPEANRDAELWLILANITQDYGKDIDAMFLLQKSATVDPTYYKAYYNMGNLYFKDNKLSKAIENYNLAIKYNKTFAYSYYNLGCCYLKDSDFRRAKSCFQKSIHLKNNEPMFYYNLAVAYKKMNNEKQSKHALQAYDSLVKS